MLDQDEGIDKDFKSILVSTFIEDDPRQSYLHLKMDLATILKEVLNSDNTINAYI